MLTRLTAAAAALLLAGPSPIPVPVPARHCDTLDGPVAMAGMRALDKGNLTPALRWVHDEQAKELAAAFEATLGVRGGGPEVRAIVDRYFLETLVRLHRASEGEPFTGLLPTGSSPGPAVSAADRALEGGSADALVKLLTEEVEAGVRRRFAAAVERRGHADESVSAGREFVAAYVEFIHYVERLDIEARGSGAHHADAHGR